MATAAAPRQSIAVLTVGFLRITPRLQIIPQKLLSSEMIQSFSNSVAPLFCLFTRHNLHRQWRPDWGQRGQSDLRCCPRQLQCVLLHDALRWLPQQRADDGHLSRCHRRTHGGSQAQHAHHHQRLPSVLQPVVHALQEALLPLAHSTGGA